MQAGGQGRAGQGGAGLLTRPPGQSPALALCLARLSLQPEPFQQSPPWLHRQCLPDAPGVPVRQPPSLLGTSNSVHPPASVGSVAHKAGGPSLETRLIITTHWEKIHVGKSTMEGTRDWTQRPHLAAMKTSYNLGQAARPPEPRVAPPVKMGLMLTTLRKNEMRKYRKGTLKSRPSNTQSFGFAVSPESSGGSH